jgi:hypothetical protein
VGAKREAKKNETDVLLQNVMDRIQAIYVERNNESRSRNHFCRKNAISITYSERVSVALVIQHAKRMRRIILSSVACLAVLYFSHIIS